MPEIPVPTSVRLWVPHDIEDDMKKMKTALTEIHSFMATIGNHNIVQYPVSLVLQLKDAVYDAEDSMDEFEYYALKKKSEKQQNTVSHAVSSTARAISQFIVGNKEYKKLKKNILHINETLDRFKVLYRRKEYISIKRHYFYTYKSSSILHRNIDLIGRQKESADLIDLLLRSSDISSTQAYPTIIPIVGVGGIGKTTLVDMVYNDPRIYSHFDIKIWISVGSRFDKLELLKKMLRNWLYTNYSFEGFDFDMLQRRLETELELKRVILILDDVWYNENDTENNYKTEWLQLLAPLKKAAQGSKIILTTRESRVERILGAGRSITLDGLNEDDSWSLFEQCAFFDQHKREELKPIGKAIVKKLKGSPLAIRDVGGQLSVHPEVEYWREILKYNLIKSDLTMEIIGRSYELLPEHLKRCFSYCSLFPKDYCFKPDRLVHMWIAHELVHSEERKKLVDVGTSYFNELLARSFFQLKKNGNKEYYVMHDQMNELACRISRRECIHLTEHISDSIGHSIRHLSVYPETIDKLKDFSGLEKLRTLMLFGGPFNLDETEQKKIFNKLKRIRVLHIGCPSLKLTNDIGGCIHLRYLSVPFSDGPLPSSIKKLHNLQVLFSN